jgi:hypothetical protein
MIANMTLFLSTLATGILAVSTATSAQNYVAYAAWSGETRAPIDRFIGSDFGYQQATVRRHHYLYQRGGCPTDQERSNRTGGCLPSRSQN